MNSVSRSLAILSHHKIGSYSPGGWPTWFYVSEQMFADQLRILHDGGFEVIDMAALRRGLDDPETLPIKGAMITFDDAYRSVLELAAPMMRKYGYPGVVFVPTQYVGGINEFDLASQPPEPLCTWDELHALESAGISVQSHGVSHPAFSNLTRDQRSDELAHSRQLLEARMNKKIDFFAYPYGDAGPDPVEAQCLLKEAGYTCACLYVGGVIQLPAPDRYRLERLAMGADSDLKALLGLP